MTAAAPPDAHPDMPPDVQPDADSLAPGRPDVLVVSIAGTPGMGTASRELVAGLERAGLNVEHATATGFPDVRTFMATDYVQARAARRAAIEAIERERPRAIVYCSVTASLLWPAPGAIWLDSVAAENRPGRHGLWQRVLERRRLAAATLVMRMAERSLDGLPAPQPDSVVVPTPVEPSAPSAATTDERDIDVLAYAADPVKRRPELLLEHWARARRPGETMVIAGTDRLPAGAPAEAVRAVGRVTPGEFRALLRRARVFAAAPRREDYGIAPLEALADGCLLATTPAAGAYPALALALELDPRLVTEDLASAIRTALDDPRAGYSPRARELLAPFGRAALDETLRSVVIPRLLSS